MNDHIQLEPRAYLLVREMRDDDDDDVDSGDDTGGCAVNRLKIYIFLKILYRSVRQFG